MTGKLIVIEGTEGAGKSSAVETVMSVLANHQIEAITTREPGGTAVGEVLRSILKNVAYQKVLDPRSELLLLYAARTQLLEEVVKPALARGCWVVSDRFELSTWAYQAGGRGLSPDIISQLSAFCLQGLKPDLTLFLDLSPQLGMQRVSHRGQLDRFEREPADFFVRVYEGYLAYAKQMPELVRLDASLALSTVLENIQAIMTQFVDNNGLS